jgi:hypothetical protein
LLSTARSSFLFLHEPHSHIVQGSHVHVASFFMDEFVCRLATPLRNDIIEYKVYYTGRFTIVVDTPRLLYMWLMVVLKESEKTNVGT